MKKQITLISLLISSLAISAQPTLTHGGTAPAVGTSFTNHTGAYISPGSSGANQTWNFGTFSGPTVNTYSMVAPSSTPFASTYPTANVCSAVPSASSYEYMEDNSTATYLVGGEASTASLDFAPNKETIFIYPLSYNGTWTDSYQVNGDLSGQPFTRNGSVTGTADGWGTLITPNGTYTNVMRIHLVQTYTDVFSFGSFVGTQDIYEWYKEGIHYPIFLATSSVYNGNPGPSQAYYDDAPSGVNDITIKDAAAVYPTLAHDEVFVKFGQNYSSSSIYEMMDITGRKILSGTLSSELNTINTQDIPAGHYLLRIISGGTVQTRKIVIQ